MQVFSVFFCIDETPTQKKRFQVIPNTKPYLASININYPSPLSIYPRQCRRLSCTTLSHFKLPYVNVLTTSDETVYTLPRSNVATVFSFHFSLNESIQLIDRMKCLTFLIVTVIAFAATGTSIWNCLRNFNSTSHVS
jgi:predicted transposase YdaD